MQRSVGWASLRTRRSMHEYENLSTQDTQDGGDPESQLKTSTNVTLLRIYSLAIINFGISATWALEMAITTPYFASALKSGPVLSHVVWVLGPISGLCVAPIVGYLSDRCTSRLGRRRPFIIVGALGTVAGMLLFPNARELGHLIHPSDSHRAALIVAVASFALMDFSINTTMFPVRALQGDLVPERQQHVVQSATVVMGSLGDLCISSVLERYPNPVASIRRIFAVAAGLYTFTSVALLFLASEERHHPQTEDNPTISTSENRKWNPLGYFRSLPAWLWSVGGVFALGFFSFFLLLPNFSAWLGESVLRGVPDAPLGTPDRSRYELGVRAVGKAGAMRAGISILVAAAYPTLLKLLGAPLLLAFAFAGYGVLVFFVSGTHNLGWGQAMVAFYSIPMTVLFLVPMAITVKKSSKVNRGKHLGALNIFAVIPQLIDTAYSGHVAKKWGESMVMRIGGAWSILAALFAIAFVRE